MGEGIKMEVNEEVMDREILGKWEIWKERKGKDTKGKRMKGGMKSKRGGERRK